MSLRVTMAVLFSTAVAAACAPQPATNAPVDPAVLQAAADSLLDESARAWNGGDLEGFVQWYHRDPETTFLGSRGLTHGWVAIHDRYAPAFEPGAERDSLRFEGLESRPLAPGLGLATARYVLFRSDSLTSTGVFTLILRETHEGWRIIHDHTSESPVEAAG